MGVASVQSTGLPVIVVGWTPDWDWTQPLRPTDASLKPGDAVWRRFTEDLTRGNRGHSRQSQKKHEVAGEQESGHQQNARTACSARIFNI